MTTQLHTLTPTRLSTKLTQAGIDAASVTREVPFATVCTAHRKGYARSLARAVGTLRVATAEYGRCDVCEGHPLTSQRAKEHGNAVFLGAVARDEAWIANGGRYEHPEEDRYVQNWMPATA